MDINLGAASSPKPALEILPLEIWIRILGNLDSESDVTACYQTCQAWANHLKQKILMLKAFPFILKYLTPPAVSLSVRGEPDEAKRAHLTTMLNMRLVSRYWKESVDNYYQTNVHGSIFKDAYVFGNDLAKLENFVEKGFHSHTNPFITRTVYFKDWFGYQELEKERGRTLVKTILETFGSQIWTCVLCFPNRTHRRDLYDMVYTYIFLMPNLKKFHLLGSHSHHPTVPYRLSFFDRLLQRKPFPRLEDLNMLTLRNIPYPLSTGILRANTHVEELKIQNCAADCLDYVSPNLKELKLQVQNSYVVCQQLKNQAWPLKVLELKTQERQTLKVMFEAFSTFGDTLEQLSFTHENGWQQGDDDEEEMHHELKLELPHLKKFLFSVPHCHLKAIDFLLGCTAIQEINLEIAIPRDEEDDEEDSVDEDFEDYEGEDFKNSDSEDDVDDMNDSTAFNNSSEDEDTALPPATLLEFIECISFMENSNIWHFLPTLKHLEIGTRQWKKYSQSWKEYWLSTNCFRRGEDGTVIRTTPNFVSHVSSTFINSLF